MVREQCPGETDILQVRADLQTCISPEKKRRNDHNLTQLLCFWGCLDSWGMLSFCSFTWISAEEVETANWNCSNTKYTMMKLIWTICRRSLGISFAHWLSLHHCRKSASPCEPCTCTSHKDAIKSPKKCHAGAKLKGVEPGWKPKLWTAPASRHCRVVSGLRSEHHKGKCTPNESKAHSFKLNKLLSCCFKV